jgi:hypothetical protein
MLLAMTSSNFDNDEKTVIITLNVSPLYDGGTKEIYNGPYHYLSDLMIKLARARRVTIFSSVKMALPEGTYSINIYENNLLIQSYEVFNSEDVQDKTRNRHLKCDVLEDIYGIFVQVLLRERGETQR